MFRRDSEIRTTSSRTRVAGGAVALALVVSLVGCASGGESSPEATDLNAINLGANAAVGEVSLDNLLLVTEGQGEPARLLGSLINEGDNPVSVTIADSDDDVTVELEGGETVRLHDNVLVFSTADEPPGARATMTVTTPADTEDVPIPVRDGSLEWLQEYLP